MGIDTSIDTYVEPIAAKLAEIVFYSVSVGDGLDLKLILVWLVFISLFTTIYLGFINIRYFKHAIDLVRGKYDKGGDGQISRFQGLATSLSGTVGLGNIAGVAIAVSVGGPGAMFWMILMGIFGMSTKFMEVACGVKYRHRPDPSRPDEVCGGPMYYLRDGFSNRGIPFLGNFMGGFFAICLAFGVLGAASLFQTNQVFQQAMIVTGGEDGFMAGKGWIFGIFMAVIVGVVIIGGIKTIAAVTSKIVPFMGVLYMLAGLIVIGMYIQEVPAAISTIFKMALVPEAGMGAVLGALLMGVQRATFSNEAGFGTAAIPHSAVKTNDHISQGFVGMLGPFIDTIIICMVTGLVIVVTGAYEGAEGVEGVALTSRAFEAGISWFPYVLFVVVFLFAYSTLISWCYYGVKAFTYLFGSNVYTETIYKVIFLSFVIIGASANLDNILLMTDSLVFAMVIPNVIGLYFLAPEIKRDLKEYLEKIDKNRDLQLEPANTP